MGGRMQASSAHYAKNITGTEQRELTGRAHFVNYPSRIEGLRKPYLLEDQSDYAIAKVITLRKIDYVNFITDLTVERDYLEQNAPFCHVRNDHVLPCLLVRQNRRTDGVLVVPDELGFVILAAYIPNVTLEKVRDHESGRACNEDR